MPTYNPTPSPPLVPLSPSAKTRLVALGIVLFAVALAVAMVLAALSLRHADRTLASARVNLAQIKVTQRYIVLEESQIARQARSAHALAANVSAEHQQAVLTECENQNVRHDATIRELDKLLARARMRFTSPAQRRQLAESQRSTVLLIDALAPKQNCVTLMKQLSRP